MFPWFLLVPIWYFHGSWKFIVFLWFLLFIRFSWFLLVPISYFHGSCRLPISYFHAEDAINQAVISLILPPHRSIYPSPPTTHLPTPPPPHLLQKYISSMNYCFLLKLTSFPIRTWSHCTLYVHMSRHRQELTFLSFIWTQYTSKS